MDQIRTIIVTSICSIITAGGRSSYCLPTQEN